VKKEEGPWRRESAQIKSKREKKNISIQGELKKEKEEEDEEEREEPGYFNFL
jgi:hypothetical protein